MIKIEDVDRECQIDHKFLVNLYNKTFNRPGFFIDIGAYDGHSISNTSCLAINDWSGIMIEPIIDSFIKCSNYYKNNSKIQVINAAISNYSGVGEINICDQLSSLKKSDRIGNRPKQPIQIFTLDKILENNNIQNIDVLSIDTEGEEANIIESFNLEKYFPKIIIAEMHESISPENGQYNIYKDNYIIDKINLKLLSHYNKVYSDHINTIFCLK